MRHRVDRPRRCRATRRQNAVRASTTELNKLCASTQYSYCSLWPHRLNVPCGSLLLSLLRNLVMVMVMVLNSAYTSTGIPGSGPLPTARHLRQPKLQRFGDRTDRGRRARRPARVGCPDPESPTSRPLSARAARAAVPLDSLPRQVYNKAFLGLLPPFPLNLFKLAGGSRFGEAAGLSTSPPPVPLMISRYEGTWTGRPVLLPAKLGVQSAGIVKGTVANGVPMGCASLRCPRPEECGWVRA